MSLGSRLRSVGRAILLPGVLLTLAALVLALLVWFVGPLLSFGDVSPLGSASVRLAILLVIVLAWGIAGFFLRTRRSNEDQALIAALRRQQEEQQQAKEGERTAAEAELAVFRGGARGAMRFAARKESRNPFARDRYRVPWYLVLGAEGAGKTALVLNSGLAFPYQAEAAEGAPAAFHLADQAVLVEMAGKFMAEEPRPATVTLWLRMLDLLRRRQPQQPVSGVIVAVGADALAAMTPETVIDFASTLRRRLDEVTARLRTRPPVYVVVTKLDLLIGFEEFFDALSAEERAAVLGLPLRQAAEGSGEPAAIERFMQGFSDMVGRLSRHLLLRLQEEPDEHRRRRAAEFPGQFAAMRSVLEPFVAHLTFAHRFEPTHLVRGLFFASTTQSGLSVDVLTRDLSAGFGQRPGTLVLREDEAARGRPYFLRGLVHDVILPEADLGGLTRRAATMMRARGMAANVLLTLAVFTLLVLWWLGFSEGRAYTKRLADDVGAARASIAAALSDGKAPTDFARTLTALDALRKLADERPGRTTFGLYGTASVEKAARYVYDKGIGSLLFPFVWTYLGGGLDDPQTAAAARFAELKLYLMLSGERPVDPDAAAAIAPGFTDKWLPYDHTPEAEAHVSGHLAELASARLAPPLTDMRLIDRAREKLSDYTLARLAYDSLEARPDIQALPVWRPVDHMSLSGPQALARVGGTSFWDGIAGLYTRSGFFETVLPDTGTVSDELGADLWVMGVSDAVADRARETRRIREGLLDLYRVDYMRQWDSFLSELTITDGATPGEVARALAIITGNPSPVAELMTAVAAEVNLAPLKGAAGALAGAAVTRIGNVAESALQPQRIVDVGKAVTDHFQSFLKAVGSAEGKQSQVDAMLAALQPLYNQINLVATGTDILELGAQPQTLISQLEQQVTALPQDLQPLFKRILSQAAAVTGGISRARIADIWKTTVAPACQATTQGRYPFVPTSNEDTPIADFAALFGPKGLIANFRNDYLKPYIDTTAKPWRWRTGQKVGLGLGDDVLAAFERAQDITAVYFGDSDQPAVAFTVEPAVLDAKANAMQFDVGGPTLVYMHGPPVATPVQWPPQRAGADAILSLTPELDGERNLIRKQGPWALFRLFDAGRKLKEQADAVPYAFTIGSRKITLDVSAPAGRNPFAADILSGFKCPVL